MNDRHRPEINDDEIRVISGYRDRPPQYPQNSYWRNVVVALIICVALGIGFFFLARYMGERNGSHPVEATMPMSIEQVDIEPVDVVEIPLSEDEDGGQYISVTDTTVAGVGLVVVTPHGATPSLTLDKDVAADASVVMMFQAAEVRKDNGGIVGSYVIEGDLVSRGQSKSGFCAIVDGRLVIGNAESTRWLERAIESGGYFFRQYPLVSSGEPVYNKPRGTSLRKALAMIDGQPSVVLSKEKVTFADFSRALCAVGVTDAIYLVGSSSYGFVKTDGGEKIEFGKATADMHTNANFIVWRFVH